MAGSQPIAVTGVWYASPVDVQNYGRISNIAAIQNATKDDINNALEIASRIIDDFTGKFFVATMMTVVVNDVRLPLIRLPHPFKGIARVSLNGRTLDPTMYQVEMWGLRLYVPGSVDVDGFPVHTMSPVASGFRGYGSPYGSRVEVTATFGYDAVPVPVNKACVILAGDDLSGEPLPDPQVGTLSVEGYRYMRVRVEPTPDTTGNTKADRLLQAYREELVEVG